MSDRQAALAGCYVHTPFCAALCPYCDFAVVAGRDDQVGRYLAAVVTEIGRDEVWRPLDAVYFGGGTPSRIDPPGLAMVLDALVRKHGVDPGAEICLEANPEDWTPALAAGLRSAGFNRVSFGAQSFDSAVLSSLGRRHLPERIAASVEASRGAGFENVSVDLIYGTPGETDASWRTSLERATEAGVDHVSCYALTVEPGTELGREVAAGGPAPDPDVQADRFGIADEILGAAGLVRYEVSNWAVPGRECVYNSIVWAQGEYVAYGNGAHRFRSGVRSRNHRRLDTYLGSIEGGGNGWAGQETLEGWDREIDRMFVGLRRVAGVTNGPGVSAFLEDPYGSRLVEAGVVELRGGRLRVLIPMLTDEVLRCVVGLQAGNQPVDANTLKATNA